KLRFLENQPRTRCVSSITSGPMPSPGVNNIWCVISLCPNPKRAALLPHAGEAFAHFVAASDGAVQLMGETGFLGQPVGVFQQFLVRRIATPAIGENFFGE